MTEKTYKEFVTEGKKDYSIDHNSFTSAVAEVTRFLERNGFEFSEDDYFTKVSTGPKKPSKGKTNKYNVEIAKNGKLVKNKRVAFQVYGKDNGNYELNLYLT